MNKVRGFKIRIRKPRLLSALKQAGPLRIPEASQEKIQGIVEEAYTLIDPAVVFDTFFEGEELRDEVFRHISLGSEALSGLLAGSEAFTLMAATIGERLEERVDTLKEKDLGAAFILDAAGSEAAEQCANFVTSVLREQAGKKDCAPGKRYSPGYGDWPLEATPRILEYIPGDKIGISLTPSGIMLPRKSITAVQPWVSR